MRHTILLHTETTNKNPLSKQAFNVLALPYKFKINSLGHFTFKNRSFCTFKVSFTHDTTSLFLEVFDAFCKQQTILWDYTTTHEETTLFQSTIGVSDCRVTFITKNPSVFALAQLTNLLTLNKLHLTQTTSIKISLSTVETAAFDWIMRGTNHLLLSIKNQLFDLGFNLQFDMAIQLIEKLPPPCQLIAFDMDSTLIQSEVIDELAKIAGIGHQVAEITKRCLLGEIDFTSSFKTRLALLKGVDASAIQTINNATNITENADELFSMLYPTTITTVIISGGFIPFAKHVQKILKIHNIYANNLQINNGKITGKTIGTIIDNIKKAEILAKLTKNKGLLKEQTIAVGDGANDIQMLEEAGTGVAFQAKPIVRKAADAVISFSGISSLIYLPALREIFLDKSSSPSHHQSNAL